jgi:hypothetical protein
MLALDLAVPWLEIVATVFPGQTCCNHIIYAQVRGTTWGLVRLG